ncbi:MAG TPA: lysophospholipid acyltransferase family protein [Ktedonobacteraceae bacterium]
MWYALFRSLFWVLTHLLCRYRVEGRERIPRQGPLLVVANHLVWYDPALMAIIFPRRLWFMAKIEAFRWPVIGWGARLTEQISVRRGASDRVALERALDYLRQGRAVLIFPEGTVARQGHMLAAHTGAAMLALRAGVPILPIAHTGTRRVFVGRKAWLPRVEVRIGEPYVPAVPEDVSRKVALKLVTEDLMRRIALMIPPEERGGYAALFEQSEIQPLIKGSREISVSSATERATDALPEPPDRAE